MSDVTVFQTQLAFSSTVPCLVSQSVPPNVTEILFLYLTCSIYKYLGLKYFLSFFPLCSYVRTGGPSHVNCTSTSCKAAASVQWASGYVTERSPETTGIRHEVIQQLCLIPRKKKKKKRLCFKYFIQTNVNWHARNFVMNILNLLTEFLVIFSRFSVLKKKKKITEGKIPILYKPFWFDLG